MSSMQIKTRPKYLNLFTLALHMSMTAKASILHRVSIVIIFFTLPFSIFLLKRSLISQDFYTLLYEVVDNYYIRLIYLLMIWSFIYFLLSEIRFLFLDIDKGTQIKKAKITALLVISFSVFFAIALETLIW